MPSALRRGQPSSETATPRTCQVQVCMKKQAQIMVKHLLSTENNKRNTTKIPVQVPMMPARRRSRTLPAPTPSSPKRETPNSGTAILKTCQDQVCMRNQALTMAKHLPSLESSKKNTTKTPAQELMTPVIKL